MKDPNTMPELTGKIPTDVLDKIKVNMASLEASLLSVDPNMKQHLREIHALLLTYPETVHLLDDAGIKSLIDAQQQFMKTQIVSETAKGKGGNKKTKIGVADL